MKIQRNSLKPNSLIPEQLDDVVSVSENEQSKKEHHTCYLGVFHEFIAGLAPADDLIGQEHHMSSIEGGDGKQVKDCEHDG